MVNNYRNIITRMKFLLVLALCVVINNGYMLYLDAKAEECFYEELKPNQKAGLEALLSCTIWKYFIILYYMEIFDIDLNYPE